MEGKSNWFHLNVLFKQTVISFVKTVQKKEKTPMDLFH